MIADRIYDQLLKRGKSRAKMRRSVAKSVTWRIIGTLDTVLIAWIVTGQMILAVSIGSIEMITKMMLYFLHERVWENISWGQKNIYDHTKTTL